jgi:glyoxylase-like metal-dependent hydrolase (beta-lactamase superfamily II)
MQGSVTQTRAGQVTIHTYIAPEIGWRAASHLIELPTQLVLVDAPLTLEYAREWRAYTTRLGKPISRLYISHAHPDHFVGIVAFDAPTYALAAVKWLIDSSGGLRIERAYRLTPGHAHAEVVSLHPVDYVVEAGEETIDGVLFSFEPVADAESADQLTIGLPEQRLLIAQDILYNHVHAFLGEHAFGAWQAALDALEARPYDIILPGHGAPGGRGLYQSVREYLATAATAFAQATGPEDLNRRLETAYPDYGGHAMQGLQNFYLFPKQS